MHPFVSILIPCYNGGRWIAQSIQSALDQTYPHKEVVVVDDGSKDESLTIIRSFGERIRYETGPNRGGNVARNRLVQLSTGNWLSFLDADDYWLPTKIEKQIVFLGANPNLDVVYGPTIWIGEDAEQKQIDVVEDEDLFANYFRWTLFSTITLLLKKAAVIDVGGWNENQRVCQEHELTLRLIRAGKKFALQREALAVARLVSNDSVSRRSPMNTLKQKMALSDQFEAHLQASGEMNGARALALAQARFEAARTAYRWDKSYARTVMTRARQGASFSKLKGVNPYYRWAIQVAGFDFAERVGAVRRWFSRGTGPAAH
jgi:glycosyltransferase involved in cell wall biosynthesis